MKKIITWTAIVFVLVIGGAREWNLNHQDHLILVTEGAQERSNEINRYRQCIETASHTNIPESKRDAFCSK